MKHRTRKALEPTEHYEAERLREFGPLPDNPFKVARNQLNLTLVEFAAKSHVTKQSIIRLEQGTFNTPLEGPVQFLVDQGYSYLVLRDEYHEYQDKMRQRNRLMFGPELPKTYDLTVHPFRQIRKHFNITYVAKSVCISQAILEHFENRIANQTIVPKTVRGMLWDLGYTQQEINFLDDAYKWFRDAFLERRNLVGVARVSG